MEKVIEKDMIMFKKTIESIICGPVVKECELSMISPLVLAYIGDGVYELFIRTYLVNNWNLSAGCLHMKAVNYVKAAAQANIIHSIMDNLSEDEVRIVKRGRNAKTINIPKNAVASDYRYATGLECLIGYLYLKGEVDRLMEILTRSLTLIER